ncbi:uncharacterized protein LOC111934635 isoform X1 [Cyanistes caeruleus]|uniref:uncharacterized protein LOC111934635 isoform X1 n=1 Tax=Cyanistes caeruleus TaxID=156563 RepID=UPI000CDA12D8|nr:uncharacterized protein LOC111934635 isoform X1 [Cyanistes caeruleus]XP_023790563.1 uncharacterized protein LOC111934635 isoform X2 [Cyanistes caeruleus]XP_023790564.1 uncharacterized protein LOC111934635 isoform X1 [Cyanistes caeruleus]
MGGTFTQVLVVLGALYFMLRADDQTVKVTEELLHQHKEQRRQEMAALLAMQQRQEKARMLKGEQKSQEMAWLLEMQQRCQKLLEIAQGSPLLSACQHWWFWASAEMLLTLFGFYWLPRRGRSACKSSACAEIPAVPRRKRRRRRRNRMHGTADCGDKLDQIRSLDLWKNMKNSMEEGMKEMIDASAKPFPQETIGQSCIQGIH